MNIRNRAGPRTDPWGTPLTTGTLPDDGLSSQICCVLWIRKEDIH